MSNAMPNSWTMTETLQLWTPMLVRPGDARVRGVLESFVSFWRPIAEHTLVAAALWADGKNRFGIPLVRIDVSTARSISIEVLMLGARWLARAGSQPNVEQIIAHAHIEVATRVYGLAHHQKAGLFCPTCLMKYMAHLGTIPLDPPCLSFAWFARVKAMEPGPWTILRPCHRDGACLGLLLERIEALRTGSEEDLDLLDMLPPVDTGDRLWSLPGLLRNLPTMLLMAFIGSLIAPSRTFWSSAPASMSVNVPPEPVGPEGGGTVVGSLDSSMFRSASARAPGRGIPANVPASAPGNPGQAAVVFPDRIATPAGVGAEDPSSRGTPFPEELIAGGSAGRTGSRGEPEDPGGGVTGGAGGRALSVGGAGTPGVGVVGGTTGRGATTGTGSQTSAGTAPNGELVQTTVTVQDMMVGSVMHRLGSRRSCTVSLSDGGSYTIDKSTNSISGKFEKDPGDRNQRVNRVLRSAMHAPQCEG